MLLFRELIIQYVQSVMTTAVGSPVRRAVVGTLFPFHSPSQSEVNQTVRPDSSHQ